MVNDPQAEEESWKFLPEITDTVARLANEIQEAIYQCGLRLKKAGLIYIHVINENFKKKEVNSNQKTVKKDQSAQGISQQ